LEEQFLEVPIILFPQNVEGDIMRKSEKKIVLTAEEGEKLEKIVNTGIRSVKLLKRAKIILELDTAEGRIPIKEESIAEKVGVSRQTVQNVKNEYFASASIDSVLQRKKRETPPTPPKITGKTEAHIIALACGEVPKGFSKWTLRLLAEKSVELQYIDKISHMTVSRLLKKHNLNLI
jgi:transposase